MTDPKTSAYERSYDAVHRFVRRRTRDDVADDLTQDVFADAAAALAQARIGAPPPLAWLYTVARRRLIDLARRGADPLPLESAPEPAHPEPAYGPGIVGVLVDELLRLPDAQRRVVVEKIFEGRPFAEIAARLAITEEAARMRFSRALARLREELERKGVSP